MRIFSIEEWDPESKYPIWVKKCFVYNELQLLFKAKPTEQHVVVVFMTFNKLYEDTYTICDFLFCVYTARQFK